LTVERERDDVAVEVSVVLTSTPLSLLHAG
jgi:hypothetical protein